MTQRHVLVEAVIDPVAELTQGALGEVVALDGEVAEVAGDRQPAVGILADRSLGRQARVVDLLEGLVLALQRDDGVPAEHQRQHRGHQEALGLDVVHERVLPLVGAVEPEA
jgi:hypothetical protein